MVRLRQGSVYPALRRLEREGLVRSWAGQSTKGGGRPRRYFELTVAGVKAARTVKQVVSGFMKGNAAPLPPARVVEQMHERLQRCAEVSAFCRELRRAYLRTTGS